MANSYLERLNRTYKNSVTGTKSSSASKKKTDDEDKKTTSTKNNAGMTNAQSYLSHLQSSLGEGDGIQYYDYQGILDNSKKNYDSTRKANELALQKAQADQPSNSGQGIKGLFKGTDTRTTEGLTAENSTRYTDLLKQLDDLTNSSGYVTTTEQSDEYEAKRKSIIAELESIDSGANRQSRSYDARDRVENTLSGWGKSRLAGDINAAGAALDLALGLHNSSSEDQKAVADSGYSGWATDELSAANIAADVKKNGSGNGLADMEAERDALYKKADAYRAQAEVETAKAKYGTSMAGEFLINATQTGLDMAADAASSALTGVNGLVNMGIRVFGQSAQEARLNGDTTTTAMKKGAVSAAIELFTEMIGGPFEKVYGKSISSMLLNRGTSAIARAIQDFTSIGLVQWGKATLEEGLEEALSDILNTLADNAFGWYTGNKTLSEQFTDPEYIEQVVYDTVLGSFMGALGASVNATAAGIQNSTNKKLYGDRAQDLVNEGLASEEGTLSRYLGEKYNRKLSNGRELSGANITRLINANEEAIAEENRKTTQGSQQNTETASAPAQANQPATEQVNSSDEAEDEPYDNPETGEVHFVFDRNNTNENDETASAPAQANQPDANQNDNDDTDNAGGDDDGILSITEKETEGHSVFGDLAESLGLSRDEKTVLEDDFNIGRSDGTYSGGSYRYVKAVEEVFASVKNGLTAEQIRQNSVFAKEMTDTQFDHAFRMAQAQQEALNGGADSQADNEAAIAKQNAYDRGRSGLSSTGVTGEENLKSYEEGRKAGNASAETKAGNIEAKKRSGELTRKKGTVKGEGVSLEDLRKKFNDSQRTAYRALSKLAEVTGIDIVLYQSTPDGNGRYTAENGRFSWRDDRIYIDINSGVLSEADVNDLTKYVMLRTFTHELTHFDEKWNPKEYHELRRLVFQNLENKGVDVDELIKNEMALDSEGNMTYDEASREVMADALSDVLPQSRFMRDMANKHESLFRHIRNKLREFVARVKQYFSKLPMNTPAAEALKESAQYAESIVNAWDRLTTGAVENYQSVKGNPKAGETAPAKTKPASKTEGKTDKAQQNTSGEFDADAQLAAIFGTPTKGANPEAAEETKKPSKYESLSEPLRSVVLKAEADLKSDKRVAVISNGEYKYYLTYGYTLRGRISKAKFNEESGSYRYVAWNKKDGVIGPDGLIYSNKNKYAYERAEHSEDEYIEDVLDYAIQNHLFDSEVEKAKQAAEAEAKAKAKAEAEARAKAEEAEKAAKEAEARAKQAEEEAARKAQEEADAAERLAAEASALKEKKAAEEARKAAEAATGAEENVNEDDDQRAELTEAMKENMGNMEPVFPTEIRETGGTAPVNNKEGNKNGEPNESSNGREAGNDNGGVDSGSGSVRGGSSGRGTTKRSSKGKKRKGDLQGDGGSGTPDVSEPAGLHREDEAGGDGGTDSVRDGNGLQDGDNAGRSGGENGGTDAGVQGDVQVKPKEPKNRNNYRITEDIDSIRPNFDDNFKAIELVKKLIEENRPATEEERAILARYKGWGGLKDKVLGHGWYTSKLRQVLNDYEFESVKDSILNAHYTSTKVISAIYKAVQKLGFKGGNILEPSMGVGNFFGMLPQELSDNSSLYGVELDKITGTIAKNLYPDANISVAGFQDILFGDGTFDLVVGNVPFSNDIRIEYRGNKFNLHDFFFVKALDETRTGGVLALITSTGTLDKLSGKTQTEIAKRANMIAAFRLPDNAFLTNAGTSVTTDLIFLQKKGPGVEDNGIRFTDIGSIDGIPVNEYYVEHPENILGALAYEKGMYAEERTVVHGTKDFEERFSKAIDSLPKNIMDVKQGSPTNVKAKKRGEKVSSTFQTNEEGTFLVDSEGNRTALSEKQSEIVKKYLEVKSLYFSTFDAENSGDISLANEYREKLNKAYDEFVSKYGTVYKNRLLLGKDDEFLRVSGLELVKDGKTSKSAIFERPTTFRQKRTSASSSAEALSIVLNEKGRVDVDEIAKLTGRTKEETVSDLSNDIILTPDGEYVLMPQYLSGNIYRKLDAVKGKKGFERNVELLKNAIPKPKTYNEISAEISSHWIPKVYMEEFIRDEFGIYKSGVKYISETGQWDIPKFNSYMPKWSTSAVSTYDILINTMNNKGITVYGKDSDGNRVINEKETRIVQNKQNDLRKAFREWIFKDEVRREELEKIYNRELNAYAPLNFDSLADKIEFGIDPNSRIKNLRDYQKSAVARIVFGGNTLLHHGVGTGKTATMIAAAHVLKNMGISNKPMFVVPNGKAQDFKFEILGMYPRANILTLDSKMLSPSELKRTKALIATNNWDYVIVQRSGFTKIGVSNETKAAFIEQQLEELERAIRSSNASIKGTRAEKNLISRKMNLEEKLKTILSEKKDDSSPFETLGIDALFVDEAHNFKKVGFATTHEVSGVDSSTNAMTTDLYMKENWLRNRGGRIVLATATPITNTVSEMYNMTLHVNPEILREAGVSSFDGWLNTFGDMRSDIEIASDAKTFRMKERIQDFKNGNELMNLYRQFADVKQTKDVVEGLPKAEEIVVRAEGTDIHQRLVDSFASRMESVSRGSRDDNALNVNNDARAAATDLRMVYGLLKEMYPDITLEALDLPSSKINLAVANIVDNYHNSMKNKGTQLVFLDSGMGRGKSKRYTFNLYGDLISKLVKAGIPRNEIADIGDYDGDANRQKLYDLVNAGTIRVLIGSTQKMGEGVNVQNKIVALHDLSVPMRADNLEQRHGRGIRHGNENKTVKIYKYIQEKSYDSYLWQMIERKSKYMAQALNGGDASDLEEISNVTVNAQQAKAIATGNPLIMEKFKLENEVNNLRILEQSFYNEKRLALQEINWRSNRIRDYQRILKKAEDTASILSKNRKDEFEMTVGKETYTKRKEAADAFEVRWQLSEKENSIELGSIYGLKLSRHVYIDQSGKIDGTGVIFNGFSDSFVKLGDSAEGNITRILNGLDYIERLPEIYTSLIERYEKELEGVKEIANRTEFPQAKELRDKLSELERIDRELGIKSDTVEFNVTSEADAESESDEDGEQYSRRRYVPEERTEEGEVFLDDIDDDKVQHSRRVTDQETLAFLNKQLAEGNVVKVYKTLQLDENGGLHSPVNGKEKVEGKRKKQWTFEFKLKEWAESSQSMNYTIDPKNGKAYVTLDKGNGKTLSHIAYNPYQHGSNNVLNDQFESAKDRPNLVTVECLMPASELTSGYHAENAKDSVGMTEWHEGPIASQLKGDDKRMLFLSRWMMPVRIVPDSEVAQEYKKILDPYGISVPFNVVTPSLLAELEKIGVPIDYEGSPQYRSRHKDEQDSARRQSLSNTELLAMASEELDTDKMTDGEKEALNIFKTKLAELRMAELSRKDLGIEYKNETFTNGGSRAKSAQLKNKIDIMDNRIKRLQAEVLSLENKDVLKGILEKARAVVEEQDRQRMNETVKEFKARQAESVAVKRYRLKVKEQVNTLRDWMMKPSNRNVVQHIPAEIQKSLADFLDSISLMSNRYLKTNGADPTQADLKYINSMQRMHDAIKQDREIQGAYSGYSDLPEDFLDTFGKLIDGVKEYMRQNSGDYVVNRMTGVQLRDLSNVLKTLTKYIKTVNTFHNNAMFEHTYEAGENTIEYLKEFSKSHKSGKSYNFMNFRYIRPSYVFERFGKGGVSIEREFREGQAVQAKLAEQIIEFSKNTFTAKEVEGWSKDVKTFTTADQETVRIPVTHIMSLYCLTKRKNALTHIYGDGIRVANFSENGKVALDEGHIVTEEDVKDMIASLTDRQKEVADALQRYMSTVCSEWGNYVSIARFDVEQFTEQHYFPINSDGRYLSATADEMPDNTGLYALLNTSFTKELKENAKNRIILYNIFDVFSNHTASMAQYRSFALPILDALKWFNYKNDTTSVRTKLSMAFGAPLEERAGSGSKGYAETFVLNLLRAYNGVSGQNGATDTFLTGRLHNFNAAQVAFNARVMIQQPLAITRAAMLISPAKLMKGLKMSATQYRKLSAEMEANSGIAAWKSLGFYDTNISRGLTTLIKQNADIREKITDVGMKGAEFADRFTWTAMWYACRDSVDRSKYGSDEDYMKAVTELFEDVIYKTQVVDSILTKAEFLRDKDLGARTLGSFMSEPSTTASMMFAEYNNYQDAMRRGKPKSEAWTEYGPKIAKTAAVYAIGQILLAGVQSIADAWRDDDDFETFREKYLAALKTNVIENLNPASNIAYVNQIYEVLKYGLDKAGVFDKLGLDLYGNKMGSAVEALDYVYKMFDILGGIISGNSGYTTYALCYNIVRAAADFTGVPAGTLMREVVDVWNNTVGGFAPSMKIRQYESASARKMREGWENSAKPAGIDMDVYEYIFENKDTDGNGSVKQDELGELLTGLIGEKKLTETQADVIFKLFWNKENSKTYTEWKAKQK